MRKPLAQDALAAEVDAAAHALLRRVVAPGYQLHGESVQKVRYVTQLALGASLEELTEHALLELRVLFEEALAFIRKREVERSAIRLRGCSVEQIPPDQPVHGLARRGRTYIEQTGYVAEGGCLNEIHYLQEL